MRLYYRKYKDFNDCALRVVRNYNEHEVTPTRGYEDEANKQMQYQDAVKDPDGLCL